MQGGEESGLAKTSHVGCLVGHGSRGRDARILRLYEDDTGESARRKGG